jgi:soluble lytic murein transglycosylase
MTGTAAWVGGGVLAQKIRVEEPVGRRGAASRRRSLVLALLCTMGAAAAGAALGLVAQPDPGHVQAEAMSWTATAAVQAARNAQARAQTAEKALAAAQARIAEFDASGAAQELADYNEAQRLGVARFMKDSTILFGDQRRQVMSTIVREARRNGLDPVLVAAVIRVESRFDPFAVSGAGACGLMQLMPPTAQWLLEKNGEKSARLRAGQLFNPILNIELGTLYLAQLLQRFDGDMSHALIAYNAGPGVARSLVRGGPSWKRLAEYPKAVLASYQTLLTPLPQVAAR